jgi:hypothetical protein
MSGYLRKSTNDMNASEWDTFKKVWTALVNSGVVARYTSIHDQFAQHSMGSNTNVLFLPWHRRMIAGFEAEMHAVDPNVVLPYWNAAQGLPSALNGWPSGINRRTGRDSGPPSQSMITNAFAATTFANFTGRLESGYHNTSHTYVGGDMGNIRRSPLDPLFYLVHCMVDRLWFQWQEDLSHDGFSANSRSTRMTFGTLSGMTAGDVLNIASLGYSYIREGAGRVNVVPTVQPFTPTPQPSRPAPSPAPIPWQQPLPSIPSRPLVSVARPLPPIPTRPLPPPPPPPPPPPVSRWVPPPPRRLPAWFR